METSYNFKVIVIGPAAAGKTSIINRFVNDEFSLNYKFTLGVDFSAKSIKIDSERIATLTIWDVGGQERFEFLQRTFYAGTNGALIIFDLSREQTFKETDKWLNGLKKFLNGNVPFILIGNKSDLIPQIGNIIDNEQIQYYIDRKNAIYITTSAKTGDKVESAFIQLTQQMVDLTNKKKS